MFLKSLIVSLQQLNENEGNKGYLINPPDLCVLDPILVKGM